LKKNPKLIKHCRKDYICVVCGETIVKGSSYISKAYISSKVTDFFCEKNRLPHWSHFLNRVYINLPCCSKECFDELSHKDNVKTMFAKNIEPIINAKLILLGKLMEHGLLK